MENALYDIVWPIDFIAGIFLKIVLIILALTYLAKMKGDRIEEKV